MNTIRTATLLIGVLLTPATAKGCQDIHTHEKPGYVTANYCDNQTTSEADRDKCTLTFLKQTHNGLRPVTVDVTRRIADKCDPGVMGKKKYYPQCAGGH